MLDTAVRAVEATGFTADVVTGASGSERIGEPPSKPVPVEDPALLPIDPVEAGSGVFFAAEAVENGLLKGFSESREESPLHALTLAARTQATETRVNKAVRENADTLRMNIYSLPTQLNFGH